MLFNGCSGSNSGTNQTTSEVIQSVKDWSIEWYHLADTQCLCQDGNEALVQELNSLSDDQLREVLENGNLFLDLIRPIADAAVESNKSYLFQAQAYRLWRTKMNWPENFEFKIMMRDPSLSPEDRIMMDHTGAYLLLPFNWTNPNDSTQALQTKIDNLNPAPNIPTFSYDNSKHLLASKVLQNVDKSIFTTDPNSRNSYNKCEADFSSPEQSEAKNLCIKKVIDDYSLGGIPAFRGPFDYPSKLDFHIRDALPLVDTQIYSKSNEDMVLTIGMTSTFIGGVVDWPCGRF